jgi:hypothetical protein
MSASPNYRRLCKSCNEIFFPSEDEIALFNEGFTPLPDKCEDCCEMENVQEIDEFSDADPGL